MALPKIGQRVSIIRTRDHTRGEAQIVDITQTAIFFDVPLTTTSHTLLSLYSKESVRISYFAIDGALQQFDSTVTRQVVLGTLDALEIPSPRPEEITRIQRRSFVRVPSDFPITFLVPQRTGGVPFLRGKGRSHDISAGGIRFHPETPIAIEPGDAITIQFALPHDTETTPPISAKGVVLRAKPHEALVAPILSIRFTEISNAAQQRIVQYAFRRQLELRAKGLH